MKNRLKKLVCEVTLSGWTEDGIMRQPVFLRLREDETAREVVREKTGERNRGQVDEFSNASRTCTIMHIQKQRPGSYFTAGL